MSNLMLSDWEDFLEEVTFTESFLLSIFFFLCGPLLKSLLNLLQYCFFFFFFFCFVFLVTTHVGS